MSVFQIGDAPGSVLRSKPRPFAVELRARVAGAHVECPRRGSLAAEECDDCLAGVGRDGGHQRCRVTSEDRASDWMRPARDVPTASPAESCAAAAERLAASGSHELLVLDDSGILIGVVCVCDLARRVGPTVADCTPRDVYVTGPGTSLGETYAAMDALAISCVPIVDGTLVLGVVGGADLKRAGVPGAIHARHRGCKGTRAGGSSP